jgi:hypothetical protein
LNQLPKRPIAWASSRPGASASAKVQNRMPVHLQPSQAPIAPPMRAPKIAMPPSQIGSIAHERSFAPCRSRSPSG